MNHTRTLAENARRVKDASNMNHLQEADSNATGLEGGALRPRRVGVTVGLALLTAVVAMPTLSLGTAAAHSGQRRTTASPEARCAAALRRVQASGLLLPAGFEYRCPGDTRSFVGDSQHWGVTCYYHQTFCPTGANIAVNPARVGRSDARLRYVVAHEIGHAIDYVTMGYTTEQSAHARARAAGF